MIKTLKGKLITALIVTIVLDSIFYIYQGMTRIVLCKPCAVGQLCHCPSGFELAWPSALIAFLPLYGFVFFVIWLIDKLLRRRAKPDV